jgi:hypothetical protein
MKYLALSAVSWSCNSHLPNPQGLKAEAVLSASRGLDLDLAPRLLEVLKVSLLHPGLFAFSGPAHFNTGQISLICEQAILVSF